MQGIERRLEALEEAIIDPSEDERKLRKASEFIKQYVHPEDRMQLEEVLAGPGSVTDRLNRIAEFVNSHISPEERRELASRLRGLK